MSQQITIPGPGDVLADRYRIVGELGRGSYGVVFLAEQVDNGREVAIKTLLPQSFLDHEVTERFSREAQLISRLSHPNLIAIYDYGQSDNLFYMVMEYVRGRSLSELIQDDAPLTPRQAQSIVTQLLSALGHAHDQGIVHRDMKPDNILLLEPAPELGRPHETVKVLDFGIAKLVHNDVDEFKTLTQAGHVLGTPHYMSPEQIAGDDVDHRADLYSAGVMLYELLTGRRPFDAQSPTAVMVAHLHEDAPALPDPYEHTKWGEAVRRSLVKQPWDRIESARVFLDVLNRDSDQHLADARMEKVERVKVGWGGARGPMVAAESEVSQLRERLGTLDEAPTKIITDLEQLREDAQAFDADATTEYLTPSYIGAEGEDSTSIYQRAAHGPDSGDYTDRRGTPTTDPGNLPAGGLNRSGSTTDRTLSPVDAGEGHDGRTVFLAVAVGFVGALMLMLLAVVWMDDGQDPVDLTNPSVSADTSADTTSPDPKDVEDTGAPSAIQLEASERIAERTARARHTAATDVVAGVLVAEVEAEEAQERDPKRVRKNRKNRKNRKSDGEQVALVITSVPSGARVHIDGKAAGITPLKRGVARGNKKLRVRISYLGYQDETVNVRPDDTRRVNVKLKKDRIRMFP